MKISEADHFAAKMLAVIRAIQATGITIYGRIARALNARGIPTARGGRCLLS